MMVADRLWLLAYLDPGDPDKGGLSTIAIIGIVAGGLLLAALVIVLIRFLWRRS